MRFSFSRLHRSRSYWIVLAVFGAANLWTWLRHRIGEPECCDQFVTVGFPFAFHVSGGFAGRNDFLVTGLLLDVVVAWTLAVLVTWIALAAGGRDSPQA